MSRQIKENKMIFGKIMSVICFFMSMKYCFLEAWTEAGALACVGAVGFIVADLCLQQDLINKVEDLSNKVG